MDKLQWFKFAPTDWMMGKIQRCPEITQAKFLKLICLYWNKECVLSIEDAEIEIDKEHLDILINKKVIKVDEDFILIDFLNEQLDDISETSQKRREAVQKRWERVKQNDTSVLQVNTNVIQSDTDKSRVEKRKSIEDKIDIDFVSPLFLETFTKWITYKKERKESYKGKTSLETFYKKLLEYSKNDPETALKIVDKSIGNNWAGIFELKEDLKQASQSSLNEVIRGGTREIKRYTR